MTLASSIRRSSRRCATALPTTALASMARCCTRRMPQRCRTSQRRWLRCGKASTRAGRQAALEATVLAAARITIWHRRRVGASRRAQASLDQRPLVAKALFDA
eukprot:2239594-Prymnesium_polylepis.2